VLNEQLTKPLLDAGWRVRSQWLSVTGWAIKALSHTIVDVVKTNLNYPIQRSYIAYNDVIRNEDVKHTAQLL